MFGAIQRSLATVAKVGIGVMVGAVVAGVSLWAGRPAASGTGFTFVDPMAVRDTRSYPAQAPNSALLLLSTPTPLPPQIISQADALQQVFVNLYQRVDPSVVNIETITRSASNDFDSSGSGFVYNQDGYIITNAHVVRDAREIIVTFRDGHTLNAELIGSDGYSDLAVIKVETDKARLVPVTLGDSSTVKVGQTVIAIGNPFGLISSMTTGIVSATGRTLSSARMMNPRTLTPFQNPAIIQVDAQINPGNSGGPLLNLNGEVIGVNTAIRSETGTFQGIGFSVPVNTVKRIIPQLIQNGRAEYTWLGIESIGAAVSGVGAGNLTVAGLYERLNLPVDYGVMIGRVVAGSPADAAGLRGGNRTETVRGQIIQVGGDIIVAINDTPVRDFDALIGYLVTNTSPGDKVLLTVYRGRNVIKVEVTLEARPN